MNARTALLAAGAALVLAACGHAGLRSMPATQTVSDMQARKSAMEQRQLPSSFIAPKHPGLLPQGAPAAQWPTGLANAGQAPVPGGMFAIENQYNAVRDGRFLTVYAGAEKSSGQGILLVVERTPDLHTVSVRTTVVAPSSVRIDAVSGSTLQLRESATGRTFARATGAL